MLTILTKVKKKLDKTIKKDRSHNFVIQPNSRRVNLTEAINLIIDFNETI